MSRLDDEIKSLDQTIETNRKLALNLAEKRDLLVQMSEKRKLHCCKKYIFKQQRTGKGRLYCEGDD